MKDKALVYISKNYVYKNKYEEFLIKFTRLFDYFFHKWHPRLPREMRDAGINYRLVKKDHVFNFLREEVDLVIVFYDLEDKVAQDLITWCTLHSKPFLIINNPLDDMDI